MYYPKIVGNKVYLSPVNPDDAKLYTKWMNDAEITLGLSNHHKVYSELAEQATLEAMSKDPNNVSFAIIDKAINQPIGNCGLFDHDPIRRTATIGIFIGERTHHSGGFGTEALALLMDFGFRSLNLHNILLAYFSYNARGAKAYRKLGFSEIGRRREAVWYNGQVYDEVLMDILEEEFRQGPFQTVVQMDLSGYEF